MYQRVFWHNECDMTGIVMYPHFKLNVASISTSNILKELTYTKYNTSQRIYYGFNVHKYHSMPETLEHRNIRLKNGNSKDSNVSNVIFM